jgi:hypothetical protein
MLKSLHGSILLAGCRVKNQKPISNARPGIFAVPMKEASKALRRQIMPGVAKRDKHLPITVQKTTSAFFCQPSDGCWSWMKRAEDNHSQKDVSLPP